MGDTKRRYYPFPRRPAVVLSNGQRIAAWYDCRGCGAIGAVAGDWICAQCQIDEAEARGESLDP